MKLEDIFFSSNITSCLSWTQREILRAKIREYAQFKCSQQRKLCYDEAETVVYENVTGKTLSHIQANSILNATHPKFD